MDSPDIAVSGTFNIRGRDYIVSLECQGKESMTVQVEDRLSSDQWRSAFDAQYVEDQTHKTGNFKQFNIFVNMLESAISKTSESVALDLLTYSDVETLRQIKNGTSSSVKPSGTASRANHLTSKRFFILTYTVEFDRIHYPLPLPYVGKPNPQALQQEIRTLQAEVRKLKQSNPSDDRRMEKLLRDYRRLEREKNDLEQEFAAFRREVRSSTGNSSVQDIRALRTLVKNLEEQLTKEKNLHQRLASKRSQEYRDLLDEVEELRASERNLRVRVKSLTGELALYKRGRTLTRRTSKEPNSSLDRVPGTRNLSSSRQRSVSNDRASSRSGSESRLRSGSRERTLFIRRSNSTEHVSHSSLNGSGLRARSNSFDRNNSANRSRLSAGSGSHRSRTPSPIVSRRFNPTAFIKEKERKHKEIVLKQHREHRANLSGISSRSKQSGNSSRNSGLSYRRSHNNSLRSDGNVSDGYGSEGSYTTTSRLKNAAAGEGRPKPSTYKSNGAMSVRPEVTRPPKGKPTKQYPSQHVIFVVV
ncbi:hypothetical protein BsWGS_09904 [Bradybaena similaris]